MSRCTCAHLRSQHRNGAGRCKVIPCPCLFGPPPAPRKTLPKPGRGGTVTTDAEGIVVDYKRPEQKRQLENLLWRRIVEAGLPMPDELEYLWARSEGRMYRSDGFYREPIPTLIEVDGGTWIGGGHSRGSGLEHDHRRDNLAALMGYRCLRFTRQMILDNTATETLRRALDSVVSGVCDANQLPLISYNQKDPGALTPESYTTPGGHSQRGVI